MMGPRAPTSPRRRWPPPTGPTHGVWLRRRRWPSTNRSSGDVVRSRLNGRVQAAPYVTIPAAVTALVVSFWVCVGLLVYTHAGYALLLALLARLHRRPGPQTPDDDDRTLPS